MRSLLPSLVWLLVLGFLFLWRFGSWIYILFTFATMKRRVLKNMATTFSFPPATPAQFPTLDLDALERYTREFEGMGVGYLRFAGISCLDHPDEVLAEIKRYCERRYDR